MFFGVTAHRMFGGFAAAPPHGATPLRPVHAATPVEVVFFGVVSVAVFAEFSVWVEAALPLFYFV